MVNLPKVIKRHQVITLTGIDFEHNVITCKLGAQRIKNILERKTTPCMNIPAEHLPILQQLCRSQPLAALATDAGSHPYVSLVAVAVTNDLRCLYFATPRATRKWANLARNPQVSLLLDNRSNQVSDFRRAAAATLLGTAREMTGLAREEGLKIYLLRHPHLADFTASPSCALLRVQIEHIFLVTRFQNVMEFHLTP